VDKRTITILRPTAPPEAPKSSAPSLALDRPLRGLKVGLRYESIWRSWTVIAQIWAENLRRDGAEPVLVNVGARAGEIGEKTRADLDAWVNSVDCAVSGIGT
jgi:hypothetical protein